MSILTDVFSDQKNVYTYPYLLGNLLRLRSILCKAYLKEHLVSNWEAIAVEEIAVQNGVTAKPHKF